MRNRRNNGQDMKRMNCWIRSENYAYLVSEFATISFGAAMDKLIEEHRRLKPSNSGANLTQNHPATHKVH